MALRRIRKLFAIIVLLVAATCVLGWLGFGQLTAQQQGTRTAIANQPAKYAALESSTQVNPKPLQLQAAPTMRDIQIDGDIVVTDSGDVLINGQLRNLFDYINTAFGAYSNNQRIEWLQQLMRHKKVPAAKTTYLLDLYKRYSRYKQQELTLTESLKTSHPLKHIESVQAIKQQIAALQKQHLNDVEIIGFYGFEQEYDRYQIQSALILQNNTMSASAKAQALMALRNQLPDAVKASVMQTTVVGELAELSQTIKQKNGSAAELFNMRAELVGADAARRLTQMDAEDAMWSNRIAQYKAQKQAVLGNPALTLVEQKQAIEALTTSSFNTHERLRLEAYE